MTPTPLDDVEFLARSGHRVEVLRTLADGARTRADLHDETGISQPTLGRILGDFEERHWVERRGREYALTAPGELVADAFEELLDTVETVQTVGDVLQQLPTELMDIDLRAFSGATVVPPDGGDAFRHIRRAEREFTAADHTLFLSDTVGTRMPERLAEEYAEFLNSDKVAESVISSSTLEQAVPDAESVRMLRQGIESGHVRSYVYDGPIPFVLAVADETVMLFPTDENGIPTALVETDDETVRAWAEDLFEQYRAQSTQVTADDLPEL